MAALAFCPLSSNGRIGAVAQLGERRNRTAEVRGSNPLSSTKPPFATIRHDLKSVAEALN
jgi:hypothetical protein